MQLTQFMVIMGFTHFSCGVQSASSSEFDTNMMCLAGHFRNKLMEQMQRKCSQIPQLRRTLKNVESCKFACEMEDTSNGHNAVSIQEYRLKDGTPCGYDKVCQGGTCIDILQMKFV
uniref:Putative ixostatin n=1 Tax=Ixodes ricinus TaxID=34613 RepID=A0A0K8RCU0_IXORI